MCRVQMRQRLGVNKQEAGANKFPGAKRRDWTSRTKKRDAQTRR